MAETTFPGERRPGLLEQLPPPGLRAESLIQPLTQEGATAAAEQPRPPAFPRVPRDPRDEPALVDGDVAGLTFIGHCACVIQGQLREACYPGRKESIISRRVHRLLPRKFLGVDRFLGMGPNQLWLTERGAAALVDGGHAREDDLFWRTRPIAAKDLRHHLSIVDLIILARRGVPFAAQLIQPAWLLQRRLVPAPAAVPDLLLAARMRQPGRQKLLAFEVDTGTEPLKVFVPKLAMLAGVLTEWAGGGPAGVVILTRGRGRAAAIERAVAGLAVPMVVELLPVAGGRASIGALEEVLRRAAKSPGG